MRFVLLLIAAVVAIVAGVAALQMYGKNTQQAPGTPATAQQGQAETVSTVNVLVAKAPVPVGSVITEALIDRQPWPKHLVLEGFIVDDGRPLSVIGKVARSPFQAREPFLNTKLANPNDPSYFAAQLPPGMRAVTIATDAVSGIAGYVFPGDRIDILFTHDLPNQLKSEQPVVGRTKQAVKTGDKPGVTEVLVPNVRVLAINLRPQPGKDTAQSTVAPSSITLEVSAGDAQALRLAEKTGTLSLSLRSLKDRDAPDVADPTVREHLTHVRLTNVQDQQIKIVRGPGKDTDDALATNEETDAHAAALRAIMLPQSEPIDVIAPEAPEPTPVQ